MKLDTEIGRFCWLDLAASDAERARVFYAGLFGWSAYDREANGGVFTRLRLGERNIGSLYQLQRAHLERGVPSHWTPYVQVVDVVATVRRAAMAGAQVLVPPLRIDGLARIAIIVDPVGAHVGLWQGLDNGDG